MKVLVVLMFSALASSAIADVNCKSVAGWSIQFNSGSQPKYTEAYEVLITGEKSVADVELQQIFVSPANVMARVELDGKQLEIQASRSGQKEEYAKYSGTLKINGKSQAVECSQN